MDPAQNQKRGGLAGGSTIDTTRVLNLFGYVGPVASLMTHALMPQGSGGLGHGHGHAAGSSGQRPPARIPGFGRLSGSGGSGSFGSFTSGGAPGRTRFVLSSTEDAIDSVLPCAAERMFKRPGRFGTAAALKFNYQS